MINKKSALLLFASSCHLFAGNWWSQPIEQPAMHNGCIYSIITIHNKSKEAITVFHHMLADDRIVDCATEITANAQQEIVYYFAADDVRQIYIERPFSGAAHFTLPTPKTALVIISEDTKNRDRLIAVFK